MLDNMGVTPTFIHAGEGKIDGNPLQPLSDRARADAQHGVDSCYRDFLVAVARGRRASVADVRKNYGEGGVLSARDAVRVGLADGMGSSLEVAIGALATHLGDGAARRLGLPGSPPQSNPASVLMPSARGGAVAGSFSASGGPPPLPRTLAEALRPGDDVASRRRRLRAIAR
jgi:ClpP class serine protease